MTDLPTPDAGLIAHSEMLLARMREVATENSLSFAEYMQLALYEPGLGYYSGGLRKFGAGGDFITAPDISPLFAQCIARQAQQVLTQFEKADVLEFGAGTGALATSLLRELQQLNCLPRRYLILEVSADLRRQQQRSIAEELPELRDCIEWLDAWPETFSGFAFGNEVLDAMPVERFRWYKDAAQQQRVDVGTNPPSEYYRPANDALYRAIEHIRQDSAEAWPEDYCSEINLALNAWFSELAVISDAMAILLLDYGYPRRDYYHGSRSSGTLRCYYQHRAHDDPFWYPGLQDITAHVDFTTVVEAGTGAGLSFEGFTSQRQFLLNTGLAELAESVMTDADESSRFGISQQVQKLTLPAHMGESFNAIGFSKNLPSAMLGFARGDQSNRL